MTALAAVLFLALALTAEPSAIIASVAAVILVAAIATLVVGASAVTIGGRARAHREALSSQPAPSHPTTAGRPRTRAPSMVVPAS
jgi:hypothetical protein